MDERESRYSEPQVGIFVGLQRALEACAPSPPWTQDLMVALMLCPSEAAWLTDTQTKNRKTKKKNPDLQPHAALNTDGTGILAGFDFTLSICPGDQMRGNLRPLSRRPL